MIVLQMLRNRTTRYGTFVANPLASILDYLEPEDWMYVKSKRNPADIAFRGLQSGTSKLFMWLSGPESLKKDCNEWSSQPVCNYIPVLRAKSKEAKVVHATSTYVSRIDRFGHVPSWSLLKRLVAWLRRFCLWMMDGSMLLGDELCNKSTRTDLLDAECLILRSVQTACFTYDTSLLKSTVSSNAWRPPRLPGQLRRLSQIIHQGILRVGGRLRWAPVPFDRRHPVILRSQHFVAQLLFQPGHIRNGHVGTFRVLNALRKKYWVIKGQAVVRGVIHAYSHYRHWHSQPEV
ncbi:hypothetical protein CRM22_007104 [Opisthorchis felineus]|uniref:Integrase zinc-binding domain-containing protein n=1 Tax=Opisthorchis felineus TaxID=147828 RepID=A0A4S2LHV8_OPIFE|nr:hypothetical protein CRM22_007104 [Opisthorchis felineus]